MKNNRLFGIIYLLLSSDTLTAKELAEYFEVSTRTIYRDIETLSEFNIPIYMLKGKGGGVRLLDNYKFDKTLLTEDEQNEILFSLQGISKLQAGGSDVYEKLKGLFSKNDESWFEVDFSTWENSPEHKIFFEKIRSAIINKNVLTFTYFNSRGETSERKVRPQKLLFKHNAWFLAGFDIAKNDARFFKITRMKNLDVSEGLKSASEISPLILTSVSSETDLSKCPLTQTELQSSNVETFCGCNFKEEIFHSGNKNNDKPHNRPTSSSRNSSIDTSPTPPVVAKIVLQIDECMAYRVYDGFDESQIQKQNDGSFIVTMEFPVDNWVYGFILSFAEYAKVLEPAWIKDEIVRKLKASLGRYL